MTLLDVIYMHLLWAHDQFMCTFLSETVTMTKGNNHSERISRCAMLAGARSRSALAPPARQLGALRNIRTPRGQQSCEIWVNFQSLNAANSLTA